MSNKRSNAEQKQPQLNHIFLAMHSQGGRARKQSKELAKKKKVSGILVLAKRYGMRDCHKEKHMGEFWDAGCVLLLDLGGGYTCVPFKTLVSFCVVCVSMNICYTNILQ